MRNSYRLLVAMMLALTVAFGSIGLVACDGGSTDNSSSTGSASSSSSQDNCYGDDLPKMNK